MHVARAITEAAWHLLRSLSQKSTSAASSSSPAAVALVLLIVRHSTSAAFFLHEALRARYSAGSDFIH
jgi:hypothetical protein